MYSELAEGPGAFCVAFYFVACMGVTVLAALSNHPTAGRCNAFGHFFLFDTASEQFSSNLTVPGCKSSPVLNRSPLADRGLSINFVGRHSVQEDTKMGVIHLCVSY